MLFFNVMTYYWHVLSLKERKTIKSRSQTLISTNQLTMYIVMQTEFLIHEKKERKMLSDKEVMLSSVKTE